MVTLARAKKKLSPLYRPNGRMHFHNEIYRTCSLPRTGPLWFLDMLGQKGPQTHIVNKKQLLFFDFFSYNYRIQFSFLQKWCSTTNLSRIGCTSLLKTISFYTFFPNHHIQFRFFKKSWYRPHIRKCQQDGSAASIRQPFSLYLH